MVRFYRLYCIFSLNGGNLMKRIFLAVIILLVIGTVAYAQQAGGNLPTSAQTRQSAEQYLSQARSNSSNFEGNLADLRSRNGSNNAASAFARLRAEIDQLEAMINSERTNIETRLDRGTRVSDEVLNRFERLLDQHKIKITELEVLIAATSS